MNSSKSGGHSDKTNLFIVGDSGYMHFSLYNLPFDMKTIFDFLNAEDFRLVLNFII